MNFCKSSFSVLSLVSCLAVLGGATSLAASAAEVADLSAVTATVPNLATAGVSDPNWSRGPFMEIYVRGYQDSDGDGVGDLHGVITHLDYLQKLGIKGIWLMPVMQSQDHDHGYAITNYRDVETAYGKLADLDELLKQAHARGIGVILDYVMNHSGTEHPLFQASRDPSSPYRSWYVWQPKAPKGWNIYGHNPWHDTEHGAYFAAFSDHMPDFNLSKPEVLEFHKNNLRFWLNRGVDGIRFDAVGHLVENGPNAWNDQPENYRIMHEIRALVTSYPKRYMVCEAPDDPRGFAADDACGGAFDFGHQLDLIKAARGDEAAIARVAKEFEQAPAGLATILSNHDSFAGKRPFDQFAGNLAHYRLAAATYLLQPGTPFIYYGEEIAMSGNSQVAGDAAIRTPMAWDATPSAGFTTSKAFRALPSNHETFNVATEQTQADSMLNWYRNLIALRTRLPSLSQGDYQHALATGKILQFRRSFGEQTSLIVINFGTASSTASVKQLPANAKLKQVFPSEGNKLEANQQDHVDLPIPAQSVQVWTVN